jgi:hypothetical protein
MAESRTEEIESPPLPLLAIDALAFLIRNRTVFLLSVLPIMFLAAISAWLLKADPSYAWLRNHWGLDFLFALFYVAFLDRWMKETLLDDAAPCEEVDELRRSVVSPRLLVMAAALFLLAMMLGVLQVEGVNAKLTAYGLPQSLVVVVAAVVTWLPHVFIWSGLVSFIVLLLPSISGVKRTSFGGALDLGRPLRSKLFALVFGSALAWLLITVTAAWGLDMLPSKPWAAAAMAAALRFGHCVVLSYAGYVLATLWRLRTDWLPPEPEDRPFRDMKLKPRKAV